MDNIYHVYYCKIVDGQRQYEDYSFSDIGNIRLLVDNLKETDSINLIKITKEIEVPIEEIY